MDWLNIFGLIIIMLMLAPNIVYAYKNKNAVNKCTNRVMNALEQTGRYGSMFLMVFNIGIWEFGFASKSGFLCWLMVSAILLLAYWAFWLVYFKTPKSIFAVLLAVIPSAIFIASGLFLRHWLLVLFGCLFACGHIYVTDKNTRAT